MNRSREVALWETDSTASDNAVSRNFERACILRSMKTSDFRWPFLIVLASIPIVGNLVEPTSLGVSAEWSDGRYRIAGGTAVWAMAYSVGIAALYLLLMYARSDPSEKTVPGLVRRWLAFWMDFVLGIMAIAPILGLIPMCAEWNRTGVFAWNFERMTPQTGDKLDIAVTTLIGMIAILAFYAFPLYRNRPSPGSCIAGYQVTVVGEVPLTLRQSLFRTLLGFVAAATPYLAPILNRNRQRGQFWLDRVFGTQAVKLN